MSAPVFMAVMVPEEEDVEEEDDEDRVGDPCAGEEGRVVRDGDKVG